MNTQNFLANYTISLYDEKESEKMGMIVNHVIANQSALNYSMIATGNHCYFNSLRDAPLVWQSVSYTAVSV